MARAIEAGALREGDRRTLARAITLVESTSPAHRQQALEFLESLQPDTKRALRIGITGPPGVGKSTLIEALGLAAIERGSRVGVLAIDPTSPVGGGSILGDKTRMEQLSRSPHAFIRPSPAAGRLGGVAARTQECILLCEAAGFDLVIVETVGVGQSEYVVAGMVDFFAVLIPPNAGDELQGIKRGLMELVDGLIVNKSDGQNEIPAQRTKAAYASALQLLRSGAGWIPRVLCCSALQPKGIDDVLDMFDEYHRFMSQSGELEKHRAKQDAEWLKGIVDELLRARLRDKVETNHRIDQLFGMVQDGRMTLVTAIAEVEALISKL